MCGENPCDREEGQVCLRTGGRTCLSRAGCHVDRQRRCVDLDALRCRRRDTDDDGVDETPTAGSGPTASTDDDDEGKLPFVPH